MKKVIVIAVIITIVLVIGTLIISKKNVPDINVMQFGSATLVESDDTEESQDEEEQKDIIEDIAYVFVDEGGFLENFLAGQLIIYNDYIFDFRKENKYFGFFTSEKTYVDEYTYRITSDNYIYIIDPNENRCVKWKYVIDNGESYLYHEDSGTKIPIED